MGVSPARCAICSIAARLRGAGTAGFSRRRFERRLLLEERDEFVQLAGELFEVRRFLGGDVEQGAGVTGGGSAAGHYSVRVGPYPHALPSLTLRNLKSSMFCLVINGRPLTRPACLC